MLETVRNDINRISAKELSAIISFLNEDYTHYFQVDQMTDEDIGLTVDSKDFMRFNDYMILLTKKILDSRLDGSEYTFTEPEEKTGLEIKDNPVNRPILEEAENEFEYLKKMFNKDNITTQTVCRAYDFFLSSVAMKSKINADKNTGIVILDSC
ncbi:hypothetical protein [Chryseobacterium indologenes]|uniref:Uncharacterized protein n=1 Tax=Chryseobacterium indologenes TaxID=253 RepID=A0A0N0IU52_CHRID|nr:hypothetical protein [Chryseobacterium indologenes]KPE49351.1 hypothetical protein AOB46_20420 [Chryseobacterium indologenes]